MALDPEAARAALTNLVPASTDDPISRALELAQELLEGMEEERGAGRGFQELLERDDPDALTIEAAREQHRFLMESE